MVNGAPRWRERYRQARSGSDGHTGVIVLALLIASIVLAVLLAHRYDLGVAQTLVTVLVGGGAPAGLYLAWVTYASARRDAARGVSLTMVADQLASAVRDQWLAEASARRLNDPGPLQVNWVAEASLGDDWDRLEDLATNGVGWPVPPPPGTWAAGPDDLAGGGNRLVSVLNRVPTGRLVVLGEPGAGKTMLMVRLVLDLLARRASGGPVPVLAPLASWNPESQDLRAWLSTQLMIEYPALAVPISPGGTGNSRIAALLAEGLIMLVLDGLDEIPGPLRGRAVSRINEVLRPGEQVVLTCRTSDYRDVIRPSDGIEVAIRAAAVVQLRRLDADAVADYLLADAGGPVAAARWAPELAALGTDQPVAQALATPLMADLARTVYNPRPGERTEDLRNPAELCALPDRTAVEQRLFDAFIPAAYRASAPGRAQRAEKCLVFLARHLEYAIGCPDLAWWQLRQAVPGPLAAFAGRTRPSRGIRLSRRWPALAYAALAFGTAVAAVVYEARRANPYGGSTGYAVVILFWVSFLLLFLMPAFVLRAEPGDLVSAATPVAVLARDRRAALLIGLVSGLLAGLGLGILAAFQVRVLLGVTAAGVLLVQAALNGLTYGVFTALVVGPVISMTQTAWPSYRLACIWLAIRQRLPWSPMSFLADAHRRGILRQAGAYYQFRHLELQHRLARLDEQSS